MDEVDALAGVPAAPEVAAADVARASRALGKRLIVLDDDPTGTQSVADLPVLTGWDEADFDWALSLDAPAVYVLTNTRSLGAGDAAERNRAIVLHATAAARRAGVPIGFVSRGDSTLRGHFPLETDVIAATLGEAAGEHVDGVVIVPAFPDAGRITIGGTHFMRSPTGLVPIAETEFARDATFGYRSSSLAGWVEEKTAGRVRADDVVVLDLGIVRRGAEAIADRLDGVADSLPIVVDAVDENDLRLLSLGLIASEARGRRLLHRVGPPFVRARIGQEVRAPLTRSEIGLSDAASSRGGLVVVGSHVGLTTRQLAALRAARPDIGAVEVDVARVVASPDAGAYLEELAAATVMLLAGGDVVLSTSRLLVTSADGAASLDVSRRVSDAVVAIVRGVLAASPPRFVVAKGGITSSDVATRGLGIRHAIVRGPMLPGIVSLWEPVDGPAVGIPFVVFAGNVGDDDSLASVVGTLFEPATAGAPAPR